MDFTIDIPLIIRYYAEKILKRSELMSLRSGYQIGFYLYLCVPLTAGVNPFGGAFTGAGNMFPAAAGAAVNGFPANPYQTGFMGPISAVQSTQNSAGMH